MPATAMVTLQRAPALQRAAVIPVAIARWRPRYGRRGGIVSVVTMACAVPASPLVMTAAERWCLRDGGRKRCGVVPPASVTAAMIAARCSRALFHELRTPPPIRLTINQRRDWPLTDLAASPTAQAGGPAALDSLSLLRYAEQCERRRLRVHPARDTSTTPTTRDASRAKEGGTASTADAGSLASSGSLAAVSSSTAAAVKGATMGQPGATAAPTWVAIAERFAEMLATDVRLLGGGSQNGSDVEQDETETNEIVGGMDLDVATRLLRSLARSRCSEPQTLRSIARDLPLERLPPPLLARCATSFLSLSGALGKSATCMVFRRLLQRTAAHDAAAWGLTAPQMLTALVDGASAAAPPVPTAQRRSDGNENTAEPASHPRSKAKSVDAAAVRTPHAAAANDGDLCSWQPAHGVLVSAIAATVPKMGAMQLEMSAYACSRAARFFRAGERPEIVTTTDALLQHGSARIGRFPPQNLLNFFVAMERLAGRTAVGPLAKSVGARLEASSLEDLTGCSVGDRYRAALCLLRAGAASPAEVSLLVGNEVVLGSLASHARSALAGRIRSASRARPDPGWDDLLAIVSVDV